MSACKTSDAGNAHSKVRRRWDVSVFIPHDVERNCGGIKRGRRIGAI